METNLDPFDQDPFAQAARPVKHSPQFWEALIALGGTPEQVAPHLPELSEAEVAAQMAAARGRRGGAADADRAAARVAPLLRTLTERPDTLRSGFGRRLSARCR